MRRWGVGYLCSLEPGWWGDGGLGLRTTGGGRKIGREVGGERGWGGVGSR